MQVHIKLDTVDYIHPKFLFKKDNFLRTIYTSSKLSIFAKKRIRNIYKIILFSYFYWQIERIYFFLITHIVKTQRTCIILWQCSCKVAFKELKSLSSFLYLYQKPNKRSEDCISRFYCYKKSGICI